MGKFRSHPDGTPHPITPPSGASRRTIEQQRRENISRTDTVLRLVSAKQRNRMRTLENEMLWQNFIKRMEKLNPDIEIDFEVVDRTLEPDEALMQLRRHYPDLNIGLKDKGASAQFREFLDEFGITNSRVQSLVAMQDPPLSEQELAELAYVLNNRPAHALAVDRAKNAPLTKDLRKYAKHPERNDIKTVDT